MTEPYLRFDEPNETRDNFSAFEVLSHVVEKIADGTAEAVGGAIVAAAMGRSGGDDDSKNQPPQN